MRLRRDELIRDIAMFIILQRATVRQAASYSGFSKSAVHVYMCNELKDISPSLYKQVREVLDENLVLRYSRGGIARSEALKNKQRILERSGV